MERKMHSFGIVLIVTKVESDSSTCKRAHKLLTTRPRKRPRHNEGRFSRQRGFSKDRNRLRPRQSQTFQVPALVGLVADIGSQATKRYF